jgi:hypothetical protein
MAMSHILKTWPAAVSAKTTAKIFDAEHPAFAWCVFSLGRGKPKQTIDRLYFTYGGRILGYFRVHHLLRYDGDNLPKLQRLDGGESGWQFKPDTWVAVCEGPCVRLSSRIAHPSFRGWRYFDLAEYTKE